MKRTLLKLTTFIGFPIVLALLLSSSSCKKFNKIVQFNLDYTTSVVIPSSTGISLPFNILTPDVTTNSEAKFREKDTRKDLITSIELTELKMTITSPQNSDFSFLKSAVISISAEGLEEKEVAFIDNVPDDVGKTLILDLSGHDLAPYVKADEFSLKLKAVTDKLIAQDNNINIESRFHVKGKILNN